MRLVLGTLITLLLSNLACSGKPQKPSLMGQRGADPSKDGSDSVVKDKDDEEDKTDPIDDSTDDDKDPVDPDKALLDEAAKTPFEALSSESSVTKVKALLTGKVPTDSELKTFKSDPKAMKTLVSQWVGSPEYYKIMERFFADAFQQSQVIPLDFGGNFGDGQTFPDDRLVRNYRQSFAKTVTEIIRNDRSFQEVATTRQFMMTTAMMMDYAYQDTSGREDVKPNGRAGTKIDRLTEANPKWSFRITEAPVSLADTMNPASPNFLKFQVRSLGAYFAGANNKCGKVAVISVNSENAGKVSDADPLKQARTGTGAYRLSNWLYRFILGNRFLYGVGEGYKDTCRSLADGEGPTLLTNNDYSDWRLVTIKPATAQKWSRFYDFPALRKADELNLSMPRVGYFSTQSFLAQFNTNFSNQARGIINQTMIVGLGQGFNGTNGDLATTAPGQDKAHAENPACYVCHNNLDPMKQYFRVNYSLNFSPQRDEDVKAVAPTFIFAGVKGEGSSLDDLGRHISQHPRFALAWAQKLCSFANSGVCYEADPELKRIAKVFADSGYKWNVLAKEIFSSPIVSFSEKTVTGALLHTPAPLARRAQFCAILEGRLGLGNLCGLNQVQTEKGGQTIPSIALQLPADQYSRGAEAASFVTEPDPFYVSAVEKVCALVADKVVDVDGQTLPFSSQTPKVAITNIVRGLMAIPLEKSLKPIEILTANFDAARQNGSDAERALKSTFVLGCMSPAVTSLTP